MIASASQTIGPFFKEGLARPAWSDLTRDGAQGDPIRIDGVVLDGDAAAIPDAMVEIWQADAEGRFGTDPAFTGFGRACTDVEGRYWFRTIMPGATGDGSAPFIAVSVFARGLLKRVITRIYFGDCAANAADPVLQSVDAQRRGTLIATRAPGDGIPSYQFDIRLQGAGETVFFQL